MNLDDMEGLDEETRKEIEELQKVTREKDGDEAYAESQFNIGIILAQGNNVSNALSVWKDIERKDSPNSYAYAQLNTGIAFEKNRDIENALSAWSNIKRTDDPKAYAHAQFDSGVALDTKGDKNAAQVAWKNINRADDLEIYSQAQYNLGLMLYINDDKESALSLLEAIDHSDGPHAYAKSRYLAAQILKEQDEYEGALKHLCDIKSSDDSRVYAKAELIIASLMKDMGSDVGFLDALCRVQRKDNATHYAFAQLMVGFDFKNKGDTKQAIRIWSNILSSDELKIYMSAQYEIGKLLIFDHESKNYADTKNAFTNAESDYPYETYCYKKICDLLEASKTKKLGLSLLKLFNLVLDIVNILTLDFRKYADEEKPFERKLAHYTSTFTANILLESDEEKNLPSAFRLNTINNVNDPSEGQLLIRKLKSVKDNNFTALGFNEEFHAFIGCFTFNNDSLNQFRLYGKQDNKEASGVSLVFNKSFFQPKNFAGGISYLSIENTSNDTKAVSGIDSKKLYDKRVQETKNENGSHKLEVIKHSVMRCVYLDPASEYFHLAQRNRLTFFREFGDKTIIKDGIKQSQAEYEWGIYQDYIKIITDEFKIAYEDLKVTYEEVETEINSVRFILGSLKQKELNTLLDEILLPLKYLIKHSAFREEQECRMIYITSIDRPEVTMKYGSFLYVEYEPSVKDHLDKIYIAPAALQHKRYFEYILQNVDVPIKVSANVFR